MVDYYDGLNQKLLDAVPHTAKRVLELGCANGRLGRRFKELHPGVHWTGVDISAAAAAVAAQHLDRVFEIDLDRADLAVLEGDFDVIVIGDLLEHLREPGKILEALYELATKDAKVVCCLPNMSHVSVLERMLAGDISYDTAGLLDQTHLRFMSPPSVFKIFLDSGWLPHMQDGYRTALPRSPFIGHIVAAAQVLGVPESTALRNMNLYQMILVCSKWSMQGLLRPGPRAPFSVIVPINRPWQYQLNIARSPGLREVGADVVCVEGAQNAAAAFAAGVGRARHAWRVLTHQDVYFPVGSGFALAQQLGAMEQSGLTKGPVGFAGIAAAATQNGAARPAGMVIDRTTLFRHGDASDALSLDEFAVALHRDSAVDIDQSFGWHLWATDLCLQAQDSTQSQAVAQILEVPLFHNSTNDYVLPDAFQASAARLLEKYPRLNRIPTLCGEIKRPRMPEALPC